MQDLSENSISFLPMEKRKLGEVLKGAYTYFRDNDIIIAKVTPCFENGKAGLATNLTNGIGFGSSEFYVLRTSEKILPEFVYFLVSSQRFKEQAIPKMTGTGGLQRVPKDVISEFQIPLPPLEVQKEIVAEIEGYQKIIDGARQVVENYQPRIPVDPDWPMVELGEICEINPETVVPETEYAGSTFKYIDISSVENGTGCFLGASCIQAIDAPSRARRKILIGDVLLSTVRPNLKAFTLLQELPERAVASTGFAVLRSDHNRMIPKYLLESIRSDAAVNQMVSMMGKGAYPSINQRDVSAVRIPLPDLSTQRTIVAQIEGEQRLINVNKELIRLFEAKIKATINRVLGEEV
jgi:type I restriction enzyme M protein